MEKKRSGMYPVGDNSGWQGCRRLLTMCPCSSRLSQLELDHEEEEAPNFLFIWSIELPTWAKSKYQIMPGPINADSCKQEFHEQYTITKSFIAWREDECDFSPKIPSNRLLDKFKITKLAYIL